MPYSTPTLRQLIETGLIDIETSLDQVLPKYGIEQALNVAVSGAIRDLYDYNSWIVRQIIPTSESDDQTIIDTARTEGVIRKLASASVGPVIFSGNAPIPVSTVMTHQDGRTYRVTSSNAPSGGSVTVDVEAEETGSEYDLPSGEQLTLAQTVPGVQPVGISGDISGGSDIEPVPQLLERLLFRKRNPPMGGAPHDYVAWCREVAGVTRAWAVDFFQGPSTIGYAYVFDDRADILPTVTDKQNMQQYIYRHADPATGTDTGRPAGIEAIDIPLSLKATNLEIHLTPDNEENRVAVKTNLEAYWRTLSPGSTLILSKVRTAIGEVSSVNNYILDLSADIPSAPEELHVLGVITWATL
ncbi:phage baseplate protein [Vibrio sp. V34_P3A8T189]|uniref:baseplate J/gp47 family protein n=1 Tax=unclassified Vibrio TaxID=2614977 RepID=UPI0013734023|nr:phage baseplate protein [Vibrio sp. V34_P3A8T189]NAX07216.1 phage baseplate protein [Vibrio sp. V40_P2S30T141]